MRQLLANGRVQLVIILLPGNPQLMVANCYGWSGGVPHSIAASRTNDLLGTVIAEFDVQPHGPKLILGDLNGDIPSFSPLYAAVQAEDYIDIGTFPGFGSTLAQATCHMAQHNSHTRRDYSFANPAALPIIDGFKVFDDHALPTHSALVLTTTLPATMPIKTMSKKKTVFYIRYILRCYSG